MITRTKCIIDGNSELEHLVTLKSFPVFIGSTTKEIGYDVSSDLVFDICKSTGLIQLRNLVDLNLVYSEYHSEAIGGTWRSHHNDFSAFVLSNIKSKNKIVEFGGGNGLLSNLILTNRRDLGYTLIEPNPSNYYNNMCKLIIGNIEDNIAEVQNSNVLIHSHTFEHITNPLETMEMISKSQNVGDLMIFSIPNLRYYLENKYVNVLNFEHTYLLTDVIMEELLNLFGYNVLKKEYFVNHSIFYSCERNELSRSTYKFSNNYLTNKKLFLDMIKNVKEKVAYYNERIKNHCESFIFGAHVFSQFLINQGLSEKHILNILDNSTMKRNKRLYGSKLKIKGLDILKYYHNPLVILNAGQYQDEIKEQIEKINSKCIII